MKIENWTGMTEPCVTAVWLVETKSGKRYIQTAARELSVEDIANIIGRDISEPFRIGQLGYGAWEIGKPVSTCIALNTRMWGSDGYVHLQGEDDWT